MKKIVIYLVCITIFLQLGFQAIQIVVQLAQHKMQVTQAIRSGRLNKHLLVFSEADLKQARWIEDHEFELQNAKYDLVKTEKTISGILYYCINDKVEKSLLKALEHSAQKSKSQSTQAKQLLLFCSLASPIRFEPFETLYSSLFSSENSYLLAGHLMAPFQPPTV